MTAPIGDNESVIRAVRIAELIHKHREDLHLSEIEREELENWINEKPENPVLFESLNDREAVKSEIVHLLNFREEESVSKIFQAIGKTPPGGRKRTGRVLRWAIAASLFLSISVFAWYNFKKNNGQSGLLSDIQLTKTTLTLDNNQHLILNDSSKQEIGLQGAASVEELDGQLIYKNLNNGAKLAHNSISTPKGAVYKLTFEDGTEAMLNAASTITYPTTFENKFREVKVTGEVYFNVVKNDSKPFIVSVGTLKIQVLGTEFSVLNYEDEEAIRTTLVQGALKVSNPDKNGQLQSLSMVPGQQVILMKDSLSMRVENVDPSIYTDWRNGKFHFQETSMSVVIRQLTRWYNVTIESQGDTRSIFFTGEISRKKSLEEVLAILTDTRKIHFEIKDDRSIIAIPGR